MGRSRLTWVGSTVAPWGIALGFLVSITAQAGQELGVESGPEALRALRVSTVASTRPEARPILEARLALGTREDLSVPPDEIEPNPTVKQGRSAFPVVERDDKGDPFIIFRPGFEARRATRSLALEGDVQDRSAAQDRLDAQNWPDESRSPARVADADPPDPRAPLPFGDGATPGAPLDFALNSSTPTPSDGKLIVAVENTPPRTTAPPQVIAAAQTTVAPQTAAAPAPGGKPDYAALIDPKDSARQMRCLAEAIYFEARSEPEAGQAAVAQVVLNRVRSGIFPTNVCGVVYQDRNHPFACQFSFACEGKSLRVEEPAAWATATRIAQAVVNGATYDAKLSEALNYHAYYVYPFWAPSLRRIDRIGAHIFYAMRAGVTWAPGALNGAGDPTALGPQAELAPGVEAAAAMAAGPVAGAGVW